MGGIGQNILREIRESGDEAYWAHRPTIKEILEKLEKEEKEKEEKDKEEKDNYMLWLFSLKF